MAPIQVDRLRHRLSRLSTRRRLVATLGTLAVMRATPTQVASQIAVPACRAEGAVCTHLMGCCTGLVCATSHINTTYGVCIPGEGEHIAVTTHLVVPDADGVVTELAAGLVEAQAAAAAATALIAEEEAAVLARRTTRRTNNDARRLKRRTRKDAARARKRARKTGTTGTTNTTTSGTE